MAKFHINAKGDVRRCFASKKACPLGGDSAHFSSREAAQKAFETMMESGAYYLRPQGMDDITHAQLIVHSPNLKMRDPELGIRLSKAINSYKTAAGSPHARYDLSSIWSSEVVPLYLEAVRLAASEK